MQNLAKLIHKTYASYLPTVFPAHYYGMPDGSIYVIFSRFYEIRFGGSGLEFVFAVHGEFKYDYENELVYPEEGFNHKTPAFAEQVDKPGSKIKIVKVCRGLNSYSDAISLLNREARQIFQLRETVSVAG